MGAGGDSSFGSLSKATGGKGAYGTGSYDDTENFSYGASPGAGGSPNGNKGSQSAGGAGFALSFTKTTGTYGQGGWGGVGPAGYPSGGGSGGYRTGYVTVTSGSTYTVTVGAGGTGEYSYRNGSSGFVLVAYGEGI